MKIQINTNEESINRIYNKYLARMANLPLPKNFVRGNRFSVRPKFIVIHDSNCLNHSDSTLVVDGPQTAMGALKSINISRDSLKDLNYHFIVDRLGNDYEVITGRPINTYCQHDDIDTAFKDSLHVIILSDLNVEVPETRFYQILAYRCLAPMIRMLKMGGNPGSIIKFHDEIKADKTNNIKCPGDFLVRELLVSQTRRYL